MKPFIIHDRHLAFDITDVDDLSRLQKASAWLIQRCDEMTGEGAVKDLDTAGHSREIFSMYLTFFGILFPGMEKVILGEKQSVSNAKRAFGLWISYLGECMEEERRSDAMMQKIYALQGEECEARADGTG